MFNRFKTRCNSKDIYDSIQPFYIFGHILGIVYYKIAKAKSGRKQYEITPLLVVKYIATSSMYCALFYFVNAEFPHVTSTLGDRVLVLAGHILRALTVGNLFLNGVFSRKIVYITNELDKIDENIRRFSRVRIQHWSIWIRSIFFAIAILFTLAHMISQVFMVFGSKLLKQGIFFIIGLMVITLAPITMYTFIISEYWIYCSIIRLRYAALNKYLKTILRHNEIRNVWISEDAQPDLKKQRKFLKSTSDSIFIVDTVASYHIKLADIAAILNQAFCVQLLLLITTSFLGIVTALFLIAINFKQPMGDSSSYNFVFTAWAFSNTIALLVVVHATCALCDEANKCPRILHKIRNNTNDAKLHTTIEMYSLQMYHNRLQFHVCGLFPLDYTLLYTIVAGVTTHLVILIQFNSFDYGPKKQLNDTILMNYTSLE